MESLRLCEKRGMGNTDSTQKFGAGYQLRGHAHALLHYPCHCQTNKSLFGLRLVAVERNDQWDTHLSIDLWCLEKLLEALMLWHLMILLLAPGCNGLDVKSGGMGGVGAFAHQHA